MQLEPEDLGVSIGTNTVPRGAAAASTVWRVEPVLFWILLVTLAAMPLPFGSARPWAWSLVAILIGLALFGYALCLIFAGSRLAVPLRRLRLPLLLIAAPVLWAVVQMTPIGQSDLAHPIWFSAGEVLGRPISGRISVDPYATGTAVMRFFIYIGIFFLAVQLCRNGERAFRALNAIVVIGAAYALYGFFAYVAAPEKLLWLPSTSHQGDLSSSFVNGSAYATFTGLGLIAAVALLAKLVHRPAVSSGNRQAMVANLLRIAGAKAWAPAAAIVALAGAVLLTDSRGGCLATGIGVLILVLCLITATWLNRFGWLAVVAMVVGGMALIAPLSGGATLGRPDPGDASANGRVAIYALVLQGIADSPLLGHGYGAFESAFQSYGDGTLDGYVPNAHNDYLQLAFELGLPAATLLVLAIAAVALSCLAGVYRRRRDIVYPAFAVAAAALVGTHALIDFSLQIPAVAALLAFILGLGYSQSWTSSDP